MYICKISKQSALALFMSVILLLLPFAIVSASHTQDHIDEVVDLSGEVADSYNTASNIKDLLAMVNLLQKLVILLTAKESGDTSIIEKAISHVSLDKNNGSYDISIDGLTDPEDLYDVDYDILVEDAAQEIIDDAVDIVNDVEDFVDDTVDDVGDFVEDAVDDGVDAVDSVVDDVASEAEDIFDSIF